MKKGKIPELEMISYRQDDNGKYSFHVKGNEKEYDTPFQYDSFKVLNGNLLIVKRVNENGQECYGAISSRTNCFFLPCLFEKIKPYSDQYVKGTIGERDFLIDKWGEVYSMRMVSLREEYD